MPSSCITSSHMRELCQSIPRRLLTPDETLKIKEMNQNMFTAAYVEGSLSDWREIARAVAVTLEKNVAMVVI